MKKIFYNYRFDFEDGNHKEFQVDFDSHSLKSQLPDGSRYPDWAQLEKNQCTTCSLVSEDYLYCPLAVNLVPIVYWSKDLKSFDKVDMTVTSSERVVHAHTSLQRAMSSLLGLLMSSSACPKMKFLRPLARFHLPLATHEETIFRAVSSSLLRLFVENKKDKKVEDAINDLKKQYDELQEVNKFIADRIRGAIKHDAAVNAIVLLDVLSKKVSYSIDDSLQQIHYLYDNDDSEVA